MERLLALDRWLGALAVREPIALGGTVVYCLASREVVEEPLFTVLEDGMRGRTAVVTELPTAVVNEVVVSNEGDVPLLLVEGEVLVGGLQDRALNLSHVLEPDASVEVPVSGVEHARWCRGPAGRKFRPSSCHSPSALRRAMTRAVVGALTSGRGPQTDQRAVYDEVARCQEAIGAYSPTGALRCVSERYGNTLAQWLDAYRPEPDEVGVVVLDHSGLFADVFGYPRLWGRLHRKLLSGYLISAMGRDDTPEPLPVSAVEAFVGTLSTQPAESVQVAGGEHYVLVGARFEGIALAREETGVHVFAYTHD